MDEVFAKKQEIREKMKKRIQELSEEELQAKSRKIENRLFDFANFMEAKVPLLYIANDQEVATRSILERCFSNGKLVVLPCYSDTQSEISLFKVDNLENDMKPGANGVFEPDPEKCKMVPVDCVDIAVIPVLATDEKGGRIGPGDGYYDRLIPRLTNTTRKVALAFEEQIINQAPMEGHDKFVDIIITEERIIYKI